MPDNDAIDKEITGWIRSGDARAFPEFVRRFGKRGYQLAFRMTGNVEDAEDVCQEAFLRMHRSLGRFDGRSSLATWVYRVALNTCHDHLRKRTAMARRERVAAQARSATTNIMDSLDLKSVGTVVSGALERLPVSLREALVMRHYLGLTFPEIAGIVGEPVTTVKSRVLGALRQVRDMLEDRCATTQAE